MKKAWLAVSVALLLALTAVLSSTSTTPKAMADAPTFGFAYPAFDQVWSRTDASNVQQQNGGRSFIWGPRPLYPVHEPYASSPNGDRLVQYFDKSRMEINQPFSKPYSAANNKYYVTNGLLPREMISGCISLGDNATDRNCKQGSADIPLSGDIVLDGSGSPGSKNQVSPTYTSLAGIASLNNDHPAASNLGSYVTATLAKSGATGDDQSKKGYNVKIADFEGAPNQLKHNVPDVFINYINKVGPLVNTDVTGNPTFNGQIIDRTYAFGYAITEPFWTRSVVAGTEKDILVQAFERRILTYEPTAPAAYRVQMGNVGLAYYLWRYGSTQSPTQYVAPTFRKAEVTYDGNHQNIGFGLNAYGWYNNPVGTGTMKDYVASKVKDLGARWVRVQVQWSAIEPYAKGQVSWDIDSHTGLESIINTLYANQIHVVVSVLGTPAWANPIGRDDQNKPSGLPANPADYANFLQEMAQHFGNKIDAYEVWNEENLAREVGNFDKNNINVAPYANLLRASWNAIKNPVTGYPWAIVVLGALTPTGEISTRAINDVDYLQKLYAYTYPDGKKVRQFFDVVGAHSGSQNNTADQKYPSAPGSGVGPAGYSDPCVHDTPQSCWRNDNSFYFRRVEDIEAVVAANDTANVDFSPMQRQIWLTEFGWDSNQNALSVGHNAPRVAGYEYADVNTEADQADRIVAAYTRAQANYPWMGVMLAWNLNYSLVAPTNDEKMGWGFIRQDGTPRPVYDKYKTLNKGR